MLRGAVAAAVFGMATTAQAVTPDTASANYQLPYCKLMFNMLSSYSRDPVPSDQMFQAGYCFGQVSGLSMFARSVKLLQDEEQSVTLRRFACADIPREVPPEQRVRVVIAYIEARPERMHERFEFLALEALRMTWPCR